MVIYDVALPLSEDLPVWPGNPSISISLSSSLSAGDDELIALPLKIKGADGALTRVVLRELMI